MWILTLTPHEAGSEVVHYYLPTGKHSVGRKGCGVALTDKSVSRLHAELEVIHAKENLALPERHPQVSITDKSRFGTLHNGTKLTAGETVRLAAGDELKFGVNQDSYRLSFVPLVAYWGTRNAGLFSREEQAHILKSLHKLGGHVAYSPENATMSVMKEISVAPISIQLLHSLARGLPIVTPAYLQAIVDRAALTTPLPSFTSFVPQIKGSGDKKELGAIETRLKSPESSGEVLAHLFDSKTFVIMSSRQADLGELIAALGGNVVESFGREADRFYQQHRRSCVILPPEDADKETQGEDKEARVKVEQFRKTGVQPISASEVASAIVLGDVSIHCNPPLAAPPARVSSMATAKAKAEPEVPVVILDETDEKDEDDDASLIITNIVEDKSNAEEERTTKRKHEQVEETKEGFLTSLRRTTGSETQPQPKKRRLVQDPDTATSDQKRKATTLRSDEDEDEDDGAVDTNKRAKGGMATVGDRNVREKEEEHEVVTEKEAAGKDDLGEAEAEEPKPKEPPVERLMVTANKRLLARPLQSLGAPNFKKFSKNTATAGDSAPLAPSQPKRPHVIACVEDDGKPSEQMESWLRESTDEEKGAGKLDSAADDLWEAKPRSFPVRGSSASSTSSSSSRSSSASAAKRPTVFSLTRHTRSASTSAAPTPTPTSATPVKKPTSRRKTTFV